MRKTKKDIEGMLKRLVENTGLKLKINHNTVYGGWDLELADTNESVSYYRLKGESFYIMLYGMNRLIETMQQVRANVRLMGELN